MTITLRTIILQVVLPSMLLSLGWEIGPFERADEVNPLLAPRKESEFFCPAQNKIVHWEIDHTFNPAAVVRQGKVYLFYRAEDDYGFGIGFHTSRIGLAVSEDGMNFVRNSQPVLFPGIDIQLPHEWPGGCEDPRIVETDEGTYVMTYTQWNRRIAVLGIAISHDLFNWEKKGYAFEKACGGKLGRVWSKSGSIVCRLEGDRLIATKINGKYWMYWGEGAVYIAVSDDLVKWEPILDNENKLVALLVPREGRHDSGLAEAGPPAILTKDGIVLLYNGKNAKVNGDPSLPAGAYSAGQALIDVQDPTHVLELTDTPFFRPEKSYETSGQYQDGTVFIEGLVHFQGKWFLYYGTADSLIGLAVADESL